MLSRWLSKRFMRVPRPVAQLKPSRRRAFPLAVEQLEDRLAPAVATLSGNILTIDYQATDGTAEAVTISNTGTNIELTGNVSGDISNAVGSVTRIVIQDSGGGTNQSTVFAGGTAFSLTAGLLATGVEFVTFNNAVTATGASGIDVTAPQTIVVSANLTGGTGGLSLTALGPPSTAGIGILINGVVSATGDVTVNGTGGWAGGHGVHLQSGSITSSGGDVLVEGNGGAPGSLVGSIGVLIDGVISATGSGKVTVKGTGGASDSAGNHGVHLKSGSIASSGGDVLVEGTGAGSIFVDGSIGVLVEGTISAAGAGAVTVKGTGGTGMAANATNHGVHVKSGSITASDGDLLVDGTGGSHSSTGVLIEGTVSATGAGKVTVKGQGGAGSGPAGNHGVHLQSGSITSSGGDVLVEGTGGGSFGSSGALIKGTVSAAGSGTVRVIGTGGVGGGDGPGANHGVQVDGGTITSSGGAVLVDGTGGGTGNNSDNYGVFVRNIGKITNAGTGANATVTVKGRGGITDGTNNHGVVVRNAIVSDSSQISSSGGAVLVEGTGGGTSASEGDNYGVYVVSGAGITSAGTGTGATVTVKGQGGNGTSGADFQSNNFGVRVSVNGSRITSSGGAVLVEGTGGGSSSSSRNHGVMVDVGGDIIGSTSGVTVKGNGGTTALAQLSSYGVLVTDAGSQITSSGGAVQVEGTGGAGPSGGAANYGVSVQNGGVITNAGTGASATVTVKGQGGNLEGDTNWGVHVTGSDSQITSSGGAVWVEGTGGGGGTGNGNHGVVVVSSGVITSAGTGAGATVTVQGEGGNNSGIQNIGVLVSNNGSITSSGGAVLVEGTGGGTGGSTGNHGVSVESGGISAGGTGNLVITATAGAGTVGADVFAFSLADTVSTSNGDITIHADSMSIGGAIDAGTKTVTLKPETDDTAINLGGADAAGVLGLTGAELNNVTAASLVIGHTQSGPITVSAASVRSTAINVQLVSGDDILISGGQFNTGGGTLLLQPGNSPAAVKPTNAGVDATASTVSFASDLAIVINGLAVDTGYTQLNVVGTVDLTGVDLILSGAYVPNVSEVFTIVSATTVTDTFNGLAPGATFLFNGQLMQITYGSSSVVLTAVQAPTITSGNATTFTVGSNGNFSITTAGYPDVNSITLTNGTLPNGVTFSYVSGTTATLSGTPAAGMGGVYNLEFTASNGVAPAFVQNFTLTVNQAPAITSANATNFAVGTPGSFQFTATGFPAPAIALSGALPSGVNFNAATATLSGTPLPGSNGVYNLTITASNGVGSNAVQNFTLTVSGTNVTSKTRILWPASYTKIAANQFRGVFTITNLGTTTLTNVRLFWPTLPNGVTVVSSTSIASLAPGKTATVTVVFQSLSNYPLGNLKFYFKPVVLAG